MTNIILKELKDRYIISACVGDYVLATKYSDKDPYDPWVIGLVQEIIFSVDHIFYVIENSNRHWEHVEIIDFSYGKEWLEMYKNT